MEGHSEICTDLTTHLDRSTLKCVPCPKKAGHEITPNCGYDDYGGRHEIGHRRCKDSTFNDGSRAKCQPCTTCPLGYKVVSPCSSTTDTKCHPAKHQTTRSPFTVSATPQRLSTVFVPRSTTNQASTFLLEATTPPVTPSLTLTGNAPLIVTLLILFGIFLLASCVCIFYVKRKRGQNQTVFRYCRNAVMEDGFSPLSATAGTDLKNVLCPDILAAPLQTVLDDLDVLEELVILLDPESHGVKNTKHLASHCSFPSTWITYTYSMKDNKSPLKAVLEGVTSRHPDWTVGQLAKLLRIIERNDAVAVLAKLKLYPIIL